MRERDACQQALNGLSAEYRLRMPSIFASRWDDHSWKIQIPKQSHRATNGPAWLAFASLAPDGAPRKFWKQPLADFAKALVCRLAQQRPDMLSEGPLRELLTAIRTLVAVSGLEPSPIEWRAQHFNDAQARLKSYNEEHAGRLAGFLQWIAGVLDATGICLVDLRWKKSVGLGNFFDPSRQRRSGRNQALDILAIEAWAQLSWEVPTDAFERILQRVVDLMVCGGFRVGEACTLPADALVREIAIDAEGRTVLNADGEATYNVGLRYWPEKSTGTTTLVKAIPSAMAPIAERAVEDLLELTARSRRTALVYARGRSPLEMTCVGALDDNVEISGEDVMAIFGDQDGPRFKVPSSLIDFLNSLGIRHRSRMTIDGMGVRRRAILLRLGDLRNAMRKAAYLDNCVPRENAFVALHECLAIVPLRAGPTHKGYAMIPRPLTGASIYAYLRGRKNSSSIFARRGMTMPDGSPISIKPGQIRYWLNTHAFRTHLNQAILAGWMGRKSIKANARYDGRSESEKTALLKIGMQAAGMLDEDPPPTLAPVNRHDDAFDTDATGLVTPVGVCTSEYDNPPCPCFVKALEHAVFDHLVRRLPWEGASAFMRRVSQLADAAASAEERDVPGAGLWHALHQEVRARFAWLPEHLEWQQAIEKSLYKNEDVDLDASIQPFDYADCSYLSAPPIVDGPPTPH